MRYQGKDANEGMPVFPVIPSIMADALANEEKQMLSEIPQQIEIINSPLSLEEAAYKDEECGHAQEQEQRKSREVQTHRADGEIEKMRLDFELTVLKRQHEENDKQRLHEEKMEHMRQRSPSRTGTHGEEEQFGGKLDPITEIELEKMRMEFELAKLKHISEENERQRQHEWKMHEEKEKQRQHEEKMEQMHQRPGNLHIVSQKVSGCGMAEAVAETSSVAVTETGKMRIELQLALEVYLPEVNEKKLSSKQNGTQESPKLEKQPAMTSEAKKAQPVSDQQNDGVTEHLGLQVPRIVVSGADSEWSSSRLDLAIETELEKRRMEFELTRLRYEHEENERQRHHEEKMEQLRQQVSPKEEDNPENVSSAADNATESAPDDLTEPPCTPNDGTDPLDIRDEEELMRTKPQMGLGNQHSGLANREGEMDAWVQEEQSNSKQVSILATQLEKMRLDMELTMTRYRYEDKEKQRQHEEKMEEMRLQTSSVQPARGGRHFLLPQDQFTLFLYCFVFIHLIYIARELMFFFIKKHEMFAIGAVLICAVKIFWK